MAAQDKSSDSVMEKIRLSMKDVKLYDNNNRMSTRQSQIQRTSKVKFFEKIQKRSFDNTPSLDESRIDDENSESFICSSDDAPSNEEDGSTDLNALIEDVVKKFKDDNFIYLKYTVPKTSENFTPYSLEVCPFEKVNKSGLYYTMSRHGVTLWSGTESLFTDLVQWQKEYQMYCKIMKIKLFAKFRLWKGFKVFEKTVKWQKYNQARSYIQENLVFVIPSLATCVVRLRTEITALMDSNFVDVELIEEWHPFYFLEIQMKIYETLRVVLHRFREVAKTYIFEACHKAIIDRGFFPTDEINFYPSAKKMRDSMSSMDRARKRRFCKLLSNFLSLCDHMMLTLLHNIVRNTFRDLKEALRVHDESGPTIEDLENLNLDAEIEPKRSVERPQNPFFMAELILRPDKVEVDPAEEVMQHIFSQLTNLILDSLMGIERFTSDPFYKIFTEPSIMGRQEDRLSGAPPDFDGLLWIDLEYRRNKRQIPKIINKAYHLAHMYTRRFETIRKSYQEDVTTDPNVLKAERDLEELRKYCKRYHHNVEALEGILPSVNLGLLKLRQGSFKEIVTPVCQDLFNVLVNYLPRLASDEVEKIYAKAIDLMMRITEVPKTTIEWVNYLRSLNKLGDEIEKLFLDVDYAHDVLIIIKDFKIFISDEDKDKYLDTEDLVIGCRDTLTEKQDERPAFIKELDAVMQLDIEDISKDIHEVTEEIQNFKYLDIKSDPDDIKQQLEMLLERLMASQDRVMELRNYQKEFRIDITKYEELEVTLQEIRLRQNLWRSIEEWNTALEIWTSIDFHSLNMEELLTLNSKILKNCLQFEKYLPANALVPLMKESAEIFKEKLPVIGYLRNPAFKPRHWNQIESILNIKVIQDDPVHISDFEAAAAFGEEATNLLMEISSQASGEAQLENMLKGLEAVWKETELSIVSHHDSKDVFVLAGSDELQAVLDDSNININTIAASKFVAPIRTKVNEWIRLMDLFGKTLDEWLTCQTSWIYLEAIFSSPDIQRQLPQESKMFLLVDKNFKKLMRTAHKTSLALPIMTDMDNYNIMRENNAMLDKITRSLEAYLEVKRVVFPRFYFLSNDELLEILAQTRVPQAVQPHLRKCFDAISKLEFGVKDTGEGGIIQTNDIISMISPEGEKLLFGKGLKARGPVEEWLSKVEEAMFLATKRYMKFGYQCYGAKDRADWFQEHPNQVVLTVSQQQWATDIHRIIDDQEIDKYAALKKFEIKCLANLSALAAITRMEISSLLRKILCALITIDVHAKDSVVNLVEKQVNSSLDFNWLKMLRFYWDPHSETMTARMASADLPYYYEYLGAGGVLVLTPLTDRCYLCLMGALQMDLGGAPAGPAGTGKTETTKDLAKSLAKQCVVFNCSEGLDYKMMGRFFSGLAQCGAWCCFDEFNRIDIEVLSVIAQQLITIRNAKVARQKRFMFEGREIKLIWSCAVFITMNPGYAGRTELPDNLKALFRPISMMVPDYALISEVILYSEGFEDPKILAHKMVQMYKLCSEQLSQQNHYDFGMRAVKSVLVMAGSLKRSAPNQREDITLIAALRDSNIPKFLADDAVLFRGILRDLFPGVELPDSSHPSLEAALKAELEEVNMQPVTTAIRKCIQLFETMCVRWGVMLVGPTGGGKSVTLHALASAFARLYKEGVQHPQFRDVIIQTLNPKSVTMDELYGYVNSMTFEWQDGLLGLAVRTAVTNENEVHQWIVCDGPVDAVWIENMNTVLDDNKMLCLANSERIKLTPWVHMVFEVQDLAQASPATVSRCGMVYVDPDDLGWQPLIVSWRNSIGKKLSADNLEFLNEFFDKYFGNIIAWANRFGVHAIHQVTGSKTLLCCELLTALIEEVKFAGMEPNDAKSLLGKLYAWCVLWSIGSNFRDEAQIKFEKMLRDEFKEEQYIKLPDDSKLWDCRINLQTKSWEVWHTNVEPFVFNSEDKYFDMQVPTVVTTKYSYIAELLFARKYPVMFTGETGVGKSVLAISALKRLSQGKIVPVLMNFSAQTSSSRTQDIIEAQLEKRKRTQLSAPYGKVVIIFIDDVNMPKLDTYGSQPPIELLRQFLDFKGFFDRDKLFWKEILEVVLGAACAPPGGGRNPLTPRFVRHFALLCLPQPDDEILKTIFSSILGGFLGEFSSAVRQLGGPIIDACVEVYARIAKELLPTPDKSHYIFNLRDLSKCVQGILQADSANYNTDMQLYRIFYHETTRVFHDRLINNEDKTYFIQLMNEVCFKYFHKNVVKENEIILFGDFMIFGQNREERRYDEIKDMTRLHSILMDYVEDYNSSTGKIMKLILFEDAICHTVRLARLLRGDRGNGLLVGVAGMGKQSLTRLAAHVNEYKCFQIELTRTYDIFAFHDDLKVLYRVAGVDNTPIVFLFIDTQIVEEEFLEDINNILNSGEVPNLFEGDDYEKVILDTREACNEQNKDGCKREEIFKFFINRTRNNLHLVISMSPVGDAFRRRCRMFPSLVNCCTIDWFSSWPSEALYSVALGLLTEVTKKEEERISLAHTSVFIHKTVETASLRYYKEMKRYYYTTPSSYLELLKLYKNLLNKRAKEIIGKRTRISNGLNKILETNDIVAVMQKQLQTMLPELEVQSNIMKDLLSIIERDSHNADLVKISVSKDEAIASEKAAQCKMIADDAAADLEIAMPALRDADDALKSLNKADINEIKAFTTPPQLVQFVLEAVCILLGAKPTWASAKTIMADVNFLKKLMEFDKEHISESTQRKIKKYIDHKDFIPQKIEKVSKVAKSVSLWVIAIDKFAKVYKVVEPKIKKQEAAEAELVEVMKIVRAKQQELAEVEAKIQVLKDNLEEKGMQFQKIQDSVDLSLARINRAGRLTSALSDEEIRWKETIVVLTKELWAIPGDVLVASACVAYLGAFSTSYRRELSALWVKECQKYNIPSSADFDLVTILGDAYELRSWTMAGLPRDSISVENGLYATRALRWPLMIDPQEQANRWIRNLEKPRNLQILKMTDASLTRVLENCIRQGHPMLIEDIDETINPAMKPVLQRETYVQEGRVYLKLGEIVIDYDENFKLYMTTKLSNPHYLPEICINVTLVNFLVTESGLEDQLLADIVAIELPAMEIQRNDLVVKINTDKQQLLALEDKVLKLLYNSKGNILDDEELVETLNDAKETSLIIAARLIDTEETEKVITATREKYRGLASNGAILYFVVAGLAEIDPMYQYSLKYFSQIFCNVIQLEHPKMELQERIETLKADELKAIYTNISRGLFENHKIIFSFLLALAIQKQNGKVTDQEFSFLTRGPVGNFPMKPRPKTLRFSEMEWASSCFLESQFPIFVGLCDDLKNSIILKIAEQSEEIATPNQKKSSINWSEKLSNFQKVVLIKTFKKERFTLSIVSYVTATLGKFFTESSATSTQLKVVYLDMSNVTPLVFVLSAGSDPMANFLKFAQDMKFMEKFYSISLGQGQGPVAENMIDKSIKFGHWVFLQNCHLATSWMGTMETIIRNITLGVVKTHQDFRLYLSSMPTKSFPINVLQNSVKVTNEPPKGIKSNLLGALNDINVDWFEKHALGANWRAIVFGLCMFHAVVLERRKFGPLGWNILYEFNESDRACGLRTLEMFISREVAQEIPWEATSYINGEITWGGRVTDYWDLRCLKTTLKSFSSERILLEDYTYSRGSFYRNPNKRNLSQYVDYVQTFPIEDDPEIFGMNQNANIVFQTKETEFVISTLLLGQPRAAGEDQEAQAGEVCLEIINKIRGLIALKVIKDNMFPALTQVDANGQLPSLTIVLVQEIDRFNNSLRVVHDSMNNLSKAIKGLVVMSEALENVFNSLMSNLVPAMWSSKSFLSIKNLPNWVADYERRIDFIQTWQRNGPPLSYWISGFFFPQSFLTGILQTHARKYILPIDSLKIEFEVQRQTVIQQDIFEAHTKKVDASHFYGGLVQPSVGIYTHGFFIEAGYYDHDKGGLCDARHGELYARLPVIHFKPCLELIEGNRYPAPTYKTQARSGVLSTTGHSTNFIVPILLTSLLPPDFWILRGTALVTAVRENES